MRGRLGAFRTVASRSVAEDTELVVTDEAKAGVEFTAANGTAIKYYGNRKINGISDEGVKVGIFLRLHILSLSWIEAFFKHCVELGNITIYNTCK